MKPGDLLALRHEAETVAFKTGVAVLSEQLIRLDDLPHQYPQALN